MRTVASVLTAAVLLGGTGCDGSTGGSGAPVLTGTAASGTAASGTAATGTAAGTTPAPADPTEGSASGTPAPGGSVTSLPGGVTHRAITGAVHVETRVSYPDSPPMGGNHDPVWADCTGTVYPRPIANENAVHSLEHGAVWVTYRPGLDPAAVQALAALVEGRDYTLMSPYPGLDHAVSVQSWGYQLKTDDPRDPAIARFAQTYRSNPRTAPEPMGSCVNPGYGS